MTIFHRICSIIILYILIGANTLSAQVPQLINYQGKLVDAGGDPLVGTYSILFTIYDSESGGTSLWSETHSSVNVTDGVFQVLLGSYETFDNLFTQSGERFLGVKVGSFNEMTPRFRLTSVAYSLRSSRADSVAGGAVVKSINSLKDDVELVQGTNITITPNQNTLVISASGGDLTGVSAGSGLTGGGTTGNVILNVVGGTGINVTADAVALNTTYTDGEYVNEGQANSVNSAMIANNAVGSSEIAADAVDSDEIADNAIDSAHISNNAVVKSINTLKDNVTLAEGSNITITPAGNTLTIAATGGGSGSIGGGGATDYISKFSNDTTIVNSALFESLGQVGIGTINPGATLDVNGTAKMTGFEMPTGATNGHILTSDASGTATWQAENGDITAVTTGTGISGGATSGSASISLNTTYTDGIYVNESQANSVTRAMIATNAVGSSEIDTDAVDSDEIATGAVTAAHVAGGEVVKTINSLTDGVTLSGSTNISVTPSGNTLTFATPADITGVTAGTGLTGGASSGNATLNVGTGTGITVNANDVALNTTYTDGRYVNEGQANSITETMILDESGAAYEYGPNFFSLVNNTALNQSVDTITIATPAGGTVIVEASGYVNVFHTTGVTDNIGLNLLTDPGGSSIWGHGASSFTIPSALPSGSDYRYPFNCRKVFTSGIPTTLTVVLAIRQTNGANLTSTSVAYATITATYYSTTYGGSKFKYPEMRVETEDGFAPDSR